MTNERFEEIQNALKVLGLELPYETLVKETKCTHRQTLECPAEYEEVWFTTEKQHYIEFLGLLGEAHEEYLETLEEKAQEWYDNLGDF